MATASDGNISSRAVAGDHDDRHIVAIPEIPVDGPHKHPSDSTSGSGDQDHHEIEIEHIEGEHQ